MHLSVRSANVVSHNAQFAAALKEQQAIHVILDHRQSDPRYVSRAGFGTQRNHMICKRRGYCPKGQSSIYR